MKNTVAIRRIIFSVIIYYLITLILSIIVHLISRDNEIQNIYLKYIIYPLSAFIAGYVIEILTKRVMLAPLSCIMVSFVTLLLMGFNNSTFPLLLLYLLNSSLGALLANAGVISIKAKQSVSYPQGEEVTRKTPHLFT